MLHLHIPSTATCATPSTRLWACWGSSTGRGVDDAQAPYPHRLACTECIIAATHSGPSSKASTYFDTRICYGLRLDRTAYCCNEDTCPRWRSSPTSQQEYGTNYQWRCEVLCFISNLHYLITLRNRPDTRRNSSNCKHLQHPTSSHSARCRHSNLQQSPHHCPALQRLQPPYPTAPSSPERHPT
jgi:hypothetical protein